MEFKIWKESDYQRGKWVNEHRKTNLYEISDIVDLIDDVGYDIRINKNCEIIVLDNQ